MFCPNCKTEYRPGFSRCSDCGAQLVERLAAPVPSNRAASSAGPELLWTGTDPAVCGVIINALDDASIPHHENTREVGAIPGLAQPEHAIFIPGRHHDSARAAMAKAIRELESGPAEPDQDMGDSAQFEADLPGEDEDGDLLEPAADDIPEDYDPDEATALVWSGKDAGTKDMLVASLRENGIGSELDDSEGFQIRVMPASEARAREIIREVTEASPPQ